MMIREIPSLPQDQLDKLNRIEDKKCNNKAEMSALAGNSVLKMQEDENKKEKVEYICLIDSNFLFELYLMNSMKNQDLGYDWY